MATSFLSKPTNLFFVYDRLMEGYDDHGKIKDTVIPLTQIGFTVQRFNHWRKNLGKLSFPIALETRDKPSNPPWADLVRETSWFKDAPPVIVRGIVYSITSESFFELDRLYRNGVQFERKKVKISIPYRAKKENGGAAYNLKLWCWMYVGKPDYWEDQLSNMFFSPVPVVEQHPISTVSDYSFFLEPTGEPPQEEQPVVIKASSEELSSVRDNRGNVKPQSRRQWLRARVGRSHTGTEPIPQSDRWGFTRTKNHK